MKRNNKMPRKFWDLEKIEYITNNLPKGIKYLSDYFGVTETAIKLVIKRNIHIKESFGVHDYFTQQDLMNELRKEGIYITRDILYSFRKNKLIRQYQTAKKSIVLYNEKDYNFLMKFFRSHTLLKESYKQIQKQYHRKFKGWITRNLIKEIKIVRFKHSTLVYIENNSLKFAIDLLTNYITSSEFAKLVYYSQPYVLDKIRKGEIKAMFLLQKYFIHRSEIQKFKINA